MPHAAIWQITTLFLDCAGSELERRYNETRRRHPMSEDKPAATGIAAERELLEPLRRWADVVMSTTDFTSNDLQQAIREQFCALTPQRTTLTISSFGFSRGTPPLADLVFDMRFLANPHWDGCAAPADRAGCTGGRIYPPGSGVCGGFRPDS